MHTLVHWRLDEHIARGKLPLFVQIIRKGNHPAGLFHDHTCSEIAIVASGNAAHLTCRNLGEKTNVVPLREGDMLVIHPGVIHAYDLTADLELWNLVYDPKKLAMPPLDGGMLPLFQILFPQTPPEPERMTRPVLHLNRATLEAVQEKIKLLDRELTEFRPGALFAAMTLFMEIVVLLARSGGDDVIPSYVAPEFRIGNAIAYLNNHYADGKIPLDRLARSANMSRRNFCRYFRETTGSSAGQYLLRLRLAHAITLLGDSTLNLESIANRCGFCTGAHFSREFTRYHGISPSRFRKERQNS